VLRIGIVHNYGLVGSGSNTYVAGLARALARGGHHVVVMSRSKRYEEAFGAASNAALGRSALYSGPVAYGPHKICGYSLTFRPYLSIETHRECFTDASFASSDNTMLDAFVQRFVVAVEEIVSAERLDVLHVNHVVPLPYIASQVAVRTNTPYIVTLHGSHVTYVLDRTDGRYTNFAEVGLNGASRVVVTTSAVAQRCRAHVPIPLQKIVHIPVGVDTERFAPAPEGSTSTGKPMPASETKRRLRGTNADVVFVGKLIADKGAHVVPFIAAAAAALDANPRVAIVGDGPLRAALAALLEGELAAPDFLELVGPRRDVVDSYLASTAGAYAWERASRGALDCRVLGTRDHESLQQILARARVAVIPSLTEEALPMVAVESVSSGVLPIADETSGLAELMASIKRRIPLARDVFEDPPGPLEGEFVQRFGRWCARALLVARDPLRGPRMRVALRDLAVKNYDWKVISSKLSGLYEEAIG
jgi:glycosyltransferase involved in cell wall biosynthesis